MRYTPLGEPKDWIWIDEYEPRNWVAVYELPFAPGDGGEYEDLTGMIEKPPFSICAAESVAAESYWRQNQTVEGLFFYDFEQMAMECSGFDLDLVNAVVWGPSDIGVLMQEWRGQPAGSLIYSFYRGVNNDPPLITVAVAEPREIAEVGNIAGLNKAAVLAALYNAASPRGKGFLQHENNEPMTEEEAVEYLFEGDDNNRMFGDSVNEIGGQNRFRFDYLKGRPLKVDISGNHVDTTFYNRDNGAGTAERALEWLRRTGQVTPPEDLSQLQQERLVQAGFQVLDRLDDEPVRFRLQGEIFSLGFADHADELREAIAQAIKELPD